MQSNFTFKSWLRPSRLLPFLLIMFCFFGSKANAQVIYSTTQTSVNGGRITSAGDANMSIGDAVVLAGTSRYVTKVVVTVFTQSTTPFTLNLSMFTNCSTNGVTGSACGSGTGTLIPGSVMSATVAAPVINTKILVTFTYTNPVDLTGEVDNQINVVLNSSKADVFWIVNETPVVGTTPPGEPAGSLFTICGSTVQNGCNFIFNAPIVNNNFAMEITAQSTAPACTGTPNPGATSSTSGTTVCASTPFTLSVANTTNGTGVTYQWQSSTSGTAGSYTNIPGATNPTYTSPGQTVPMWYQLVVTCGATPGTSAPLALGISPTASCYCIPAASNCSIDDEILNVTFGTLNNNSSGCSGAGYSNYTALPAPTVYSGGANPISVTIGPGLDDNIAVWIDYDHSGTFDVNEFTYLGEIPEGTVTGIITPPTSALPGITRMRVRVNFFTLTNGELEAGDACTQYTYGETEDYNVNITPCVAVTITTPPASVSINCGSNTSFTVVTTGSLPQYSWQYRTSSSGVWQTLNDGGIFSGTKTSTITLTSVSQAYSGYQFRALVTGACSAVDFSAPPATLTVNQLVPVVSPASATICQGAVQQLTLTNTTNNAVLISEGFNTVAPLPAGWAAQNNSAPVGSTGWFQGDPLAFPAQSGPEDSYIAANFNNTTGANTISNWLFTPAISMKNGDVFTFWTESYGSYPDRMQVRQSLAGASTNVGSTNASVGDFTNMLLEINPTLAPGGSTNGYPDDWKQYTITISGLASPTTGRLAFRYFVPNGGPSGANSVYIGIDNVVYTSTGGPALGVWSGPAGTIFTNSGATTPYVAGTPTGTVYVTPSVTSNYTVTYTTPTPCTSATTTVPVNVSIPVTAVVAPANRAACVGTSTTFTTSAAGSPLTYQWQVSTDGGVTFTNISGATSASYTLSGITQAMNNYRYRATVTSSPCASVNSGAAILTVNALPTVTLTATDLSLTPGQTSTITGASTPAAQAGTWIWTLDGSPLAGTTNTQTVNANGFGTYQASVTDINGCKNTSNALTIGGEASDRVWIYPNPSAGAFQVRLFYDGALNERRMVSIYKSNGTLVTQKEFELNNSSSPYMQMDFNLGSLAAGTYLVKVHNKFTGKVVSGLVVIQHD